MTDEKLLTEARRVLQECRWNESLQNDWGTGDDMTYRMVDLDDILKALGERLARVGS